MSKFSIGAIIVFLLGLIIGSAIYNLYNAKIFSYFSSDSSSCNNCHVMNEVFDDYSKSSHKAITCSDCHLPHSFVSKCIAKAQAGLGHAYHFTFDKNLPSNFSANDNTKKWVQNNCIRCHNDYAKNAINPTLDSNSEALNCVSCHKNVGHSRDF